MVEKLNIDEVPCGGGWKYRLALTVVGLGSLSACMVPVNLNQSLDDATTAAVRRDNKIQPGIQVDSNLPDPYNYFYPTNTVYTLPIPLNSSFEADMNDYFNTKFPSRASADDESHGDPFIHVTLSSFTAVTPLLPDNCRVATTMAMKVWLKRKGKPVIEKIIQAANESSQSENTACTPQALTGPMAMAVNGNINKLIAPLEKYLKSLGY